MRRILYLGPEGTFTEQAARVLVTRAYPGSAASDSSSDSEAQRTAADVVLEPAVTVQIAMREVASGHAEAVVAPVENSVEGSVPATLDALDAADPMVAVAETVLPVRFTVLATPGLPIDDIRTVATHPHAAAQVRQWLAGHLPAASIVSSTSTAAAALEVLEGRADAAVTAPLAAQRYPLDVVATDVADVRDAVTSFRLMRLPGRMPAPTGADRTAIVVTVDDRVGTLADLLTELAVRGVNLTRIESRPTRDRLGSYRFFLDLDGHLAERRVADALAALRRRCQAVRFLGSFPRADGHDPADPAPPEPVSDAAFAEAESWVQSLLEGSPS
ncbi:prephenate dehydratase [Actinoalloteichus hymeniacidonis]|uniref:Prephenate dehydratase n=1 Tax=Actinoalloteichus hymeniacidonis TaxID=340345 RepID=A0AAC9HKN0_9PSEU|nr:prephenate dehydratase [Actinoalloteichus hymeniacidonis]AOS60969.1 prephenate dehydratase [Actinoalloteichus hymeniacidonis]MBB5911031.1 prephenate dehydratase [Actinoalloteichus hymeniacidonis]